ncbi:phosphate regulon sensor histidine kinase PhoR [Marinobacter lutaoensis]|jgi:two-component system phosphate regulon sensor histidine kinase PhoR|uniref:Phosphate regulon sensor protein PhoR n=1 Tax=Marinobacter lutaoensis TaxID=135739 RepID=A0A1V2DST0_9GAMM|nr:phosphate regulon sensor histidine kinase PhoR [Marinobacter lutaoensis]MBE01942.1 PAS domain-containing sensor histidine kinase [Marinobacter sp.]MBI43126.1 PAS domain-containing sensor histidine kinase [Oceanospirillales bacterium]NVD36923.1 phosphate regulon sensor histidine kinase PhoR [Marinobacter lutaoensis]ONF43520.1 PAS domain-containing sensor histidine kinase [Marinobacter lutaoensis]|tara:strand:+ start:1831 stop:3150 length:1320 start_codon:yes stop_codon:yes gene_type:complete
MQRKWSRYLRTVIGGLIATTLIGAIFGYPLYGLLAGLLAYVWWTLVQARRLHQWLANPNGTDEAPQSLGLWGDIFDGLHKLHQSHLRTQDRLRAQVNRVQESTNAMRDGVIMTDAQGAMEWWNGSAEHLLGFRRNTDRGQYIHNLIRTPAFKAYFDSRDYREPLEIHSPAKPHIRLQIQISLFGDDDRLIVAKDVTRLYQLEQMRRDFVGNVSHEMRTPLTVISGYLETLVDHADELPPKWRRAIETMAAQASRMEALITDLILLSRIETGEHTVDDSLTDVDEMLHQICHDARALSGDKGHTIDVNILDNRLLRGDESQLRSAFSNLVFNAVKYTPAGGRITVTWRTDRDGAHLSVKDTGIGIDPIHIPRLTERFYRADPSRHKDTGGTGLGLAIVKHVLLNHDGNLEIRSRIGEGSEFTCHFPRERLVERVPEAPVK